MTQYDQNGLLRFTVESDRGFPVSEPSDNDHNYYLAKRWTLHLRSNAGEERTLWDLLARTGAECLTGEYCGGDSFAEWCEPYRAQDWYAEHGTALHVVFTAQGPINALSTARALLNLLPHPWSTDASVSNFSTAGDWAEQTPFDLAPVRT